MPYTCQQAILATLAANGPMDSNDLKHECRTQATDYTPYGFADALIGLWREGKITRDDEDILPVYDLP